MGRRAHNKWIVFFGEDWGRHASTGQYFAAEIAKEYNVLWINSLGLRAPKINRDDILRMLRKLDEFIKSILGFSGKVTSQLPEGLEVVTPIAIPWHQYWLTRILNRALLRTYLNRELSRRQIVDPIVISACPSSVIVIDDLPACIRVYYCADEYSALPGMEDDIVQPLETELLKKVDLVIVTARELQRTKSQLHQDVRYLPHGVDYDMFSAPLRQPTVRPRDIIDIDGPVVGFVGLIGEHLNFELVRYSAEQLKDVTFIMIGPIEKGTKIPKVENIRYLGAKTREELPGYLAQFHVCIIPYVKSRRNSFANPSKCREYLAAGCPIVSTPHIETENLSDAIYYAEDKETFMREISRLVKKRENLSRHRISLSVKDQTWQQRAKSMMQMIEDVARNRA